MLDYALNALVDGLSLPGILLIVLPLALCHWMKTNRRWLFLPVCLLFVFMSVPVTGKLLLLSLEIGTVYADVDPGSYKDAVDAVAVLSGGLYTDTAANFSVPHTASYSRLKRGEMLAAQWDVPLIISGTDDTDGGRSDSDILGSFAGSTVWQIRTSGARGTADHAENIRKAVKGSDIKRLAVFVSGIHAYRTKLVFEENGFDVPLVIVGLRDSVFKLSDIVPSFIGFFYWKHALKEYAGLAYYFATGRLSSL